MIVERRRPVWVVVHTTCARLGMPLLQEELEIVRPEPWSRRLARASVMSEVPVALHRRPLSPKPQAERRPSAGALACLVVP